MNLKPLYSKMSALFLLLLSFLSVAPNANAWIGGFHHRDIGVWRGGRWVHGYHGGRMGWWWFAAGTWYFYNRPVYPYPDPYVPSTVVIQPQVVQPQVVMAPPPAPAPQMEAAPPQVVAQAPAPAPQPAPQYWYQCKNPAGYYPYIPSCPGGWTAVPAAPQQ